MPLLLFLSSREIVCFFPDVKFIPSVRRTRNRGNWEWITDLRITDLTRIAEERNLHHRKPIGDQAKEGSIHRLHGRVQAEIWKTKASDR